MQNFCYCVWVSEALSAGSDMPHRQKYLQKQTLRNCLLNGEVLIITRIIFTLTLHMPNSPCRFSTLCHSMWYIMWGSMFTSDSYSQTLTSKFLANISDYAVSGFLLTCRRWAAGYPRDASHWAVRGWRGWSTEECSRWIPSHSSSCHCRQERTQTGHNKMWLLHNLAPRDCCRQL